MTASEILSGNVEEITAHVAAMDDLEEIQALIDAEGAEDGKRRKGVLGALDKRADELAKSPEHAANTPAAEPVDVDGFWAQVLQGDLSMVRRRVEEISNEADLDAVEKLEQAGRNRAGVFMVTAQRRKALQPAHKRKGKVKPPVWLDADGNVQHLNGVQLIGKLVPYPTRGYAAQVYDADLEGHAGRYKAHLSLRNGMPIGGTMGDYLQRIYAKDDGE